MKREDILKSPAYWTANIQIELFRCAIQYMKEKGINRKQLADQLGVSRSYVTQVLNGDFDHRLSKLVSLALEFGYVPKIDFIKIENYIQKEKNTNFENEIARKGNKYEQPKDDYNAMWLAESYQGRNS